MFPKTLGSIEPKIRRFTKSVRYIYNRKSTNATTFQAGILMNPVLTINNVYTQRQYMAEHVRLAFTRSRLSSNNLRIGIGRWAIVLRDERICTCNVTKVQDEFHALFECSKSEHIRNEYRDAFLNINQYFTEFYSLHTKPLAHIAFKILSCF